MLFYFSICFSLFALVVVHIKRYSSWFSTAIKGTTNGKMSFLFWNLTMYLFRNMNFDINLRSGALNEEQFKQFTRPGDRETEWKGMKQEWRKMHKSKLQIESRICRHWEKARLAYLFRSPFCSFRWQGDLVALAANWSLSAFNHNSFVWVCLQSAIKWKQCKRQWESGGGEQAQKDENQLWEILTFRKIFFSSFSNILSTRLRSPRLHHSIIFWKHTKLRLHLYAAGPHKYPFSPFLSVSLLANHMDQETCFGWMFVTNGNYHQMSKSVFYCPQA